jgi:hypothetical protein
MLRGQTPEQVPHCTHDCSFSQPGIVMISLQKALSLSASYLMVLWIVAITWLSCVANSGDHRHLFKSRAGRRPPEPHGERFGIRDADRGI